MMRVSKLKRARAPVSSSMGAAPLVRVLVVGGHAGRQLHPGVAPGGVDRDGRRRKARVGEAAHRYRDASILVAFLGVEEVGAADRAEAEPEPRALVADPNVLARIAEDFVGRAEGGQRRKDAAGT